jgi:hypothetical protein
MSQAVSSFQTSPNQPVSWLSRVAFGALAAMALVFLCALWTLVEKIPAMDLAGIVERHGIAFIGVPVAAALALFLISVIRAIDGPMEFDLLGLRANGAGAAIILWIAVFVAVGLLIRAMW